MAEYLAEEEQYKEILNNAEIARIQDPVLREIRSRYWNLRHKAFIDEQHISDTELRNIWDQLKEQEKQELEKYRKSKGINI